MLSRKLLIELQEYVERHSSLVCFSMDPFKIFDKELFQENTHQNEIENFIEANKKPTFSQMLFGFIDTKNVTDIEVYKRAGIDRKHFSKIRSNDKYKPGKNTAIALAFALELSKEETDDLLNAAGYSLSESETFDLVIQFCLEKKIYDLLDVNQALDTFCLKPLSGVLES